MRRYLLIVVFGAVAVFATAATAATSPGTGSGEDQGTPSSFSDSPGIPGASDFPKLVGVEHELFYDVGKYVDPAGKRWIRLRGQYDSVFKMGIENLVATLWAFDDSPKIFSRIIESRVRSVSEDGREVVTEQKTGICALGFSYTSNIVVKNTIVREGPMATIEFSTIEADAVTLYSRGSWILEEIDGASGPLTYVRYSLDTCVASRFPAQEWIMRRFGGGDLKRLFGQLHDGAVSRSGAN